MPNRPTSSMLCRLLPTSIFIWVWVKIYTTRKPQVLLVLCFQLLQFHLGVTPFLTHPSSQVLAFKALTRVGLIAPGWADMRLDERLGRHKSKPKPGRVGKTTEQRLTCPKDPELEGSPGAMAKNGPKRENQKVKTSTEKASICEQSRKYLAQKSEDMEQPGFRLSAKTLEVLQVTVDVVQIRPRTPALEPPSWRLLS